MKKYHSDLNPEASWKDALVFNIVPTSEERMLIAEAIDSLEGDLWHEAGEQDWLDGRKLERIETSSEVEVTDQQTTYSSRTTL